jgi:LacI family transcriptional regulator
MQRIPKVILLIESSRASGRAFLRGVATYTHHQGPWSVFWEPAGLEEAWAKLVKLDADGIIMRDVSRLEQVLGFGVPTVVLGHHRKEVSGLVNVVTDSRNVARLAAEHLLQCGFRNFAFCTFSGPAGVDSASWSEERRKYFAHYIRQAGFETHEYCIESKRLTRDWTRERLSLAQWLSSLPKPLGLMASNDDCGVQIMEACKLARVPVPDEVGVVGVDDDEIVCGLADPPMSSVAVNFERAGYEAAQALGRLMRRKRKSPARISVQATHVVARRSTDFVAVTDPAVAKALQFIRDNSRHAISVGHVATAAALSRRALERRFRNETGSSILEQIRRVRTDQIARLLVETHLPVSQVADSLGFEDVQHFARYFATAKKMSPLAYRRAYGVLGAGAASQKGDFITQTGVFSPLPKSP